MSARPAWTASKVAVVVPQPAPGTQPDRGETAAEPTWLRTEESLLPSKLQKVVESCTTTRSPAGTLTRWPLFPSPRLTVPPVLTVTDCEQAAVARTSSQAKPVPKMRVEVLMDEATPPPPPG